MFIEITNKKVYTVYYTHYEVIKRHKYKILHF